MLRNNPFNKYLKPEDILHVQVCAYIKMQYPGAVIHHSPNEGKRSPFERYLISLLQVSSGFPDLLIFYKNKVIALELKAGKNKPNPKQVEWLALLDKHFPAVWTGSFEGAKGFIDEHFK